jgi:hypothetical protein
MPGDLVAPSTATHVGSPIDVGRVRLWLPRPWQLSTVPCPPGSSGCTPTCPPGAADTVYVTANAQWFSCQAARATPSVWIVPRRLGTGQATTRRLSYGHGSVEVAIPRLGVTLYGFSPAGARIALGFSDAALTDLLTERLALHVPSGWRRVSLGTLSVAVPRRWPLVRGGAHNGDPGTCGFAFFPRPVAFTGFGEAVYFCPMIDDVSILRSHVSPGNGVWLETDGYALARDHYPYLPDLGPSTTVVRHLHGIDVTLSFSRSPLEGSDFVGVVARHDGRVGTLVLGLGRTPGIAATILSSLRLTAR